MLLAAPALLGAVLVAAATLAGAQTPAPAAPPPTPAAPPATPPAPTAPAPASPVSGIRNKIAAGDLLSAESILEVHRAEHGEDSAYLSGLSWLARGALLLGDAEKAKRYVSEVRERCAKAIAQGTALTSDQALETALGAAIEVEAQLIARKSGPRKAAEFLRKELAAVPGPVALRSRLNKRINMLTMAGSPAAELALEDFVGDPPPTLASLKGKPIVLFLWAEWCGDCKAQQGALARVRKRHVDDVVFIALTRYYDEEAKRPAEKERVADVWKSVYADVGAIPVVLSTASMERYGGSSTPAFVFVDRAGVVREYTPTRLTEAELERALAAISR